MLNWPSYTNTQAEQDFQQLEHNTQILKNIRVNFDFQNLRDDLIEARNKIYDKYNMDEVGMDKLKYQFDLEFGMELFLILNDNYNFSNRDASNDEIWKYLSIKIIPDIVHSRYGLSETRYHKQARRIWLKQIYWYINLGWQGDKSSTLDILKNNTTDTILNIVERPANGYNIILIREILKQYADYTDTDRSLLRRVLVLNTALAKTISPEFTEGGITHYVQQLYERVS